MGTVVFNDFVKNNIKKCYDLMIDFLHSESEDEKEYCSMRAEMRKYKICIPPDLYNKIEKCADKYLDPLIYDRHNVFAEQYTEDVGYYDEAEGIFRIRDEEGMKKYLRVYFEKMISIEEAIEKFAMEELHPILTR